MSATTRTGRGVHPIAYRWRPRGLGDLQQLTEALELEEPSSRALRRLNDELDTSAGGDRPKATLVDAGRLWLVKMQARGDRQAMPAREFVTMRLAEQAGLNVAPIKLHTFGMHQVLMVQCFDRDGDPYKPTRKLYASAQTVLRLRLDSVRGDPERPPTMLALDLTQRVVDRGQHQAQGHGLDGGLNEAAREVKAPGLLRNSMHHERRDACNVGGLQRAPDGVVDQCRADAFLVVVPVDGKTAQDEHRHRVWPVALHGRWRFGMAHGPCGQAIVANHRVALAHDIDSRRSIGLVFGRTTLEPVV